MMIGNYVRDCKLRLSPFGTQDVTALNEDTDIRSKMLSVLCAWLLTQSSMPRWLNQDAARIQVSCKPIPQPVYLVGTPFKQ